MKKLFKSIAKYFKGVGKEISRIKWVPFKKLVKYSAATLGFIIFFSLFFYLIDLGVALLRSI